jgi:ATP-binding cassette, subfamily B (MDR/TAP), member 1
MDPRTEVPPSEGQPVEAIAAVEEKVLSQTQERSTDTSTSAHSATDEKQHAKKAPSDTDASNELEAALQQLPEDERRVIEEQLHAPAVSVNFFSLYRYADSWDHFIIVVASLCAIAGGAALPLFTASSILGFVHELLICQSLTCIDLALYRSCLVN